MPGSNVAGLKGLDEYMKSRHKWPHDWTLQPTVGDAQANVLTTHCGGCYDAQDGLWKKCSDSADS